MTFREEPRTFNRLLSSRRADGLLVNVIHETLVRVNRQTGQLEPRLAREWTVSPDGRTYTLKLRQGVVFSDGVPFTAADVVFTLRALYDSKVASPMASSFEIGSERLQVRAIDDHTVTMTFPAPYGPGLTVLESLPILPRHKLEVALDKGEFGAAWNLTTAPAEIVTLGPFVLAEFVPGQHVRVVRNPHFWNKPLPRLDEIEIQFVPELGAEMLRLQSGQVDLTNDYVRAENLASLRQTEKTGTIRLVDAGVDIAPNALWFDLAADSPHAKDKPWLQREELRKAISYGVDRQAIADTVYLGAAVPIFGPITPGHGEWYASDLPRTDYDVKKARDLLASIGLTDRNGDGALEDAHGRPARFTILTQKGNTPRERTASVLQSQLKTLGLAVDISTVDPRQLISSWSKGDYDAIYYGVVFDSIDPARNSEFWKSSGSFHLWNPTQERPATAWEARIDDLMRRQSTTIDANERHKAFKEAQLILFEHMPCIYFVSPKETVAMSARVTGAVPSVLFPHVLWNAEALGVTSSSASR